MLRITALVLALATWANPAQAQTPDGALQAFPFATVGVNLESNQPMAFLRDGEWGTVVAIPLTIADAQLLVLAVQDVPTPANGGGGGGGGGGRAGAGRAGAPRPGTFGLMTEAIRQLGGTVEGVDLSLAGGRAGGVNGLVHLRGGAGSGELLDLPSRGGDALALAIRSGAPVRIPQAFVDAAPPIDFIAIESQTEVVHVMGMTVTGQPRTQQDRRRGMLVLQVSAELAELGLKRGDVIVDIDGNVPVSSQSFLQALGRVPPTAIIHIVFVRDGVDGLLRIPPGKLARPGVSGR